MIVEQALLPVRPGESHRDGFRRSEAYQAWRALLHPFYDVLPRVAYYGEAVVDGGAPGL